MRTTKSELHQIVKWQPMITDEGKEVFVFPVSPSVSSASSSHIWPTLNQMMSFLHLLTALGTQRTGIQADFSFNCESLKSLNL